MALTKRPTVASIGSSRSLNTRLQQIRFRVSGLSLRNNGAIISMSRRLVMTSQPAFDCTPGSWPIRRRLRLLPLVVVLACGEETERLTESSPAATISFACVRQQTLWVMPPSTSARLLFAFLLLLFQTGESWVCGIAIIMLLTLFANTSIIMTICAIGSNSCFRVTKWETHPAYSEYVWRLRLSGVWSNRPCC